jgi:hypothetical protein
MLRTKPGKWYVTGMWMRGRILQKRKEKLIECIWKVFLEDIADNFTNALGDICNRFIPLRVVLDGFS